MDFAADLPLFYADFGVEVTHTPKGGGSATSNLALHDQPGLTVLGGDVIATDHGLRYPAASFPFIRKGDSLVVASVSYIARENAQPTRRGDEMTVPLAKA